MNTVEKKDSVAAMRSGFTLIEIMIVVAILGILGTIAVQSVFGNLETAKVTAAEQGVVALRDSCVSYSMKHKKLPTSLDQLTEGDDPILETDKGLYDPWDNKYEMEKKGSRIIVKSAGPDGQMGTEDDIRTDSKKKKSN